MYPDTAVSALEIATEQFLHFERRGYANCAMLAAVGRRHTDSTGCEDTIIELVRAWRSLRPAVRRMR
jgi:hypothetical protein